MATLRRRAAMQRRMLESIGNKSPEELGRLVLDMMENTNMLYNDLGIDDAGEGDTFEYDLPNLAIVREAEQRSRDYENLRKEYARRFSGVNDNNSGGNELPLDQPAVDDIMVQVDPDTGVTETYDIGAGTVDDKDIFGEDY